MSRARPGCKLLCLLCQPLGALLCDPGRRHVRADAIERFELRRRDAVHFQHELLVVGRAERIAFVADFSFDELRHEFWFGGKLSLAAVRRQATRVDGRDMNHMHADFFRGIGKRRATATSVLECIDDVADLRRCKLLENILAQRRFHIVKCFVHGGRDLRDVDQHPARDEFHRWSHPVGRSAERSRTAIRSQIGQRHGALRNIRSFKASGRRDVVEFLAGVDLRTCRLGTGLIRKRDLLDVALFRDLIGLFFQLVLRAQLIVGDLDLVHQVVGADARIGDVTIFRRAELR